MPPGDHHLSHKMPKSTRQNGGGSKKQRLQPYKRPVRAPTRFRIPNSVAGYRTGFPKQLTMSHTYHMTQEFQQAANPNDSAFINIRCNGMFDPEFAIGGHQPSYFDITSSIYDHYQVVSSVCKVRFTRAGDSNDPWVFGILINDDGVVNNANLHTLCEQPSATYKMVGGFDDVEEVTKYWSAKSAFGPGYLGMDSLKGDAGTDPTEQQMFTIFGRQSQLTTTGTFVRMSITITYTARWTELRDVASS